MIRLSDEEKKNLKWIVDKYEAEDRAVRDRQIRTWRKLKLLWDGFQRVWYSETAHDWRIWDEQQDNDANQQDYYNKPINVFRAYLESIIAALSVTIPAIKCYPDDAENPLDISTAKAGDKISELISRHNDTSYLWIHALYIYCTEGMVACYNYTREDESYGKYSEDKYKDEEVETKDAICPICRGQLSRELAEQEEYEFDPGDDDIKAQDDIQAGKMLCPTCLEQVDPEYKKGMAIVQRFVGKTDKPKARQCLEAYGGLYVKVANYAKQQSDTPYLIFSYETNYAFAREWYPKIREKIHAGTGSPQEPYGRWGRVNTQYQGEIPLDNVTVKNTWLRQAAFESLEDKEACDSLKKKFPNGCKVVFIEQEFAEACNESMDDHWTLTNNPLADYLYFDPVGSLLTSIQEITNDLVSLTLQTIEHGIPQTFADPSVLNFDAYRQMETVPGAIYPSNRLPGGKDIKTGFYEVRTATLSSEVMPFGAQIQEYGQLVSGAQPSLFGGNPTGGSGTASEYSMSRAQSLQRLQTTWKMFTIWWKQIYGKAIPGYMKIVQEQGDEKLVKKDNSGGFVNIIIRKADLEGKLGDIEIEANENLPMTWSQRRDVIMQLMQANNPQILAMLAQPENLELIYEAIGITDFYVPGSDDRNKQLDEIKQLLNSTPIPQPPSPEAIMQAQVDGVPPQEQEIPSVEVDPLMDNHAIEFEICRKWAVSEAGMLAKIENPEGYKNVLLHAVQHKQLIPPPITDESGAAPLANPKQNKQAPITGEADVNAQP